ncbi:unnamed protein product [Lymnaea stagnalis]|uniref:TNFR-Cys domain-containing protein n=1 Tax=Lymnaea stagnalis TaxID=6523 RepID=A0AAV2HH68_LYMST
MKSNGILFVVILSQIVTAPGQGTCDEDIPSRQSPRPDFLPMALTSNAQPPGCGAGEYLDWFSCEPCEYGTFMTRKMAREGNYIRCSDCYRPDEDKFEILEEPCTKTRDAKIMCEDGYYRRSVPGKPCQSECARCDVCGLGIFMFSNHEGRQCHGDLNTVCCPHGDMVVEAGICLTTTPTTTTGESEVSIRDPEAVVLSTASVPGGLAPSNTPDDITMYIVLLIFQILLIKYVRM